MIKGKDKHGEQARPAYARVFVLDAEVVAVLVKHLVTLDAIIGRTTIGATNGALPLRHDILFVWVVGRAVSVPVSRPLRRSRRNGSAVQPVITVIVYEVTRNTQKDRKTNASSPSYTICNSSIQQTMSGGISARSKTLQRFFQYEPRADSRSRGDFGVPLNVSVVGHQRPSSLSTYSKRVPANS